LITDFKQKRDERTLKPVSSEFKSTSTKSPEGVENAVYAGHGLLLPPLLLLLLLAAILTDPFGRNLEKWAMM
jgi:hypothetical protein